MQTKATGKNIATNFVHLEEENEYFKTCSERCLKEWLFLSKGRPDRNLGMSTRSVHQPVRNFKSCMLISGFVMVEFQPEWKCNVYLHSRELWFKAEMPGNMGFTSSFPKILSGNNILDTCSYIHICISKFNFPTLQFQTIILGYFSYID